MSVALWVVQIILAVVFLFGGVSKLTQRREALIRFGMGYVEDFTPTQVKLIGTAELLGAIGVIAPFATGIAPVLTPVAALGLALLMVGAIVTHLRRKEPQVIVANLVLLAAAVFVAVGRF